MYTYDLNAKIIPAETVIEIQGRGMKDSGGGVNSCMIYLIHCKNLCKCSSVPLLSTTIKVFFKLIS
jgi:hypothetical protein